MSPILGIHIAAGTVGLFSGAAAVSFRKGSRRHATAGKVFAISMFTLALSALYLALLKQEIPNVLGGIFTAYLVGTGWLTVRRRDESTSALDWHGLAVISTLAGIYLSYGIQAAQSATGVKYGYRAPLYFVSFFLSLIAAVGDIRLLVRGGISGTQRLARHIWRMCYGLFVASGSIFLARPHLFPAFMQKTGMLLLLGFGPLLLMFFWLIRIRFTNRQKKAKMPQPQVNGAYGVTGLTRANALHSFYELKRQ